MMHLPDEHVVTDLMQCIRHVELAQFFVWGLNPVARWKYRHIPGPTPGLFFGNLLQVNLRAIPNACNYAVEDASPHAAVKGVSREGTAG